MRSFDQMVKENLTKDVANFLGIGISQYKDTIYEEKSLNLLLNSYEINDLVNIFYNMKNLVNYLNLKAFSKDIYNLLLPKVKAEKSFERTLKEYSLDLLNYELSSYFGTFNEEILFSAQVEFLSNILGISYNDIIFLVNNNNNLDELLKDSLSFLCKSYYENIKDATATLFAKPLNELRPLSYEEIIMLNEMYNHTFSTVHSSFYKLANKINMNTPSGYDYIYFYMYKRR